MSTELDNTILTEPNVFRRMLMVDVDGMAHPFAEVLDGWQCKDFLALDSGWQLVAGRAAPLPQSQGDAALGPEKPYQRAYLERPRGHSKTLDLAVMIVWALLAGVRKLSGVCAAADKDQLRLIRDAIDGLVRLNQWLADVIDVQKDVIRNTHTGSELVILSSDAATSYGLTPDFVVADELTHWKSRDLWDSLISASAKRVNCVVVIISNAGLGKGTSWQWSAREACRQSENWYFSRQDGPVATWITQDRLDEQRRLLPTSAFKRLWLNEWLTDAGDALSSEDIEASILVGPKHLPQPGPLDGTESDYVFCAGLDLGIKHDHSALLVLGVHGKSRRFRLAMCRSWAPGPDGKVDLQDVQDEVLRTHKRFNLTTVGYDPYQAELLSQQATRKGVNMRPVNFVGKALNQMASTLLEVFRSRAIDLYADRDLIRDLQRLSIVEKSYGFRLESTRDAEGHADRATALAIALLIGRDLAASGAGQTIHMDGGFFIPRPECAPTIFYEGKSNDWFR